MKHLKRRQFVKLCGGAVTAMFLNKSHGSSYSTDCIVVGAGVSGLAAADYLRKRGWKVVILEASERVGKRGGILLRSAQRGQHDNLGKFLLGKGKPLLDLGWSGVRKKRLRMTSRTRGTTDVSFDWLLFAPDVTNCLPFELIRPKLLLVLWTNFQSFLPVS